MVKRICGDYNQIYNIKRYKMLKGHDLNRSNYMLLNAVRQSDRHNKKIRKSTENSFYYCELAGFRSTWQRRRVDSKVKEGRNGVYTKLPPKTKTPKIISPF